MEAGPSRDDAGPRHDADGVQRGGQRWGSGRGRGGRQRGGRARQHAPSFDVITVPRSSVPNPASVPFIPEAAIFVPPSHRPRPAQPLADPAPQAETSGRGRSGRRSRGTAVPDGAGRTAGQTSTSEVPVVYPAGPRRRALNANAPPHIPADRPGASAAPPGGPADGRVEGTSEAAIFVPNDGASQRPGGNGEAEGRGRRKGRGGKEAGAAAGSRRGQSAAAGQGGARQGGRGPGGAQGGRRRDPRGRDGAAHGGDIAAVEVREIGHGRGRQGEAGVDDYGRKQHGYDQAGEHGHDDYGHDHDHGERHECVVCSEVLRDVAVGPCNHACMCGFCALKNRLCYGNTRCPVCNHGMDRIVIAPFASETSRGESGDERVSNLDFSDLMRRQGDRACMHYDGGWAKGVYVVKSPDEKSPPLWQRLVGRTSLSCRTCDVSGARPFPSVRALAEHVSSQHRRRMCFVCLHSRQRFPMEWPTMTGAELKAHMRECHPRCEFCDCHFYDADACYRHMGSEHFQCMLCMAGGDYRYFETAQEMAEHNRTDHYVCTEPPCCESEGLIAFRFLEDWQRHMRDAHSRSMPRFDRSRARPIEATFLFGDSATTAAPRAPRNASRHAPTSATDANSNSNSNLNAVGDADATSANAGGAGVEGGRGRSRADVLRARAQGGVRGAGQGAFGGGGGGGGGSEAPSLPSWPPHPSSALRQEEFPSISAAVGQMGGPMGGHMGAHMGGHMMGGNGQGYGQGSAVAARGEVGDWEDGAGDEARGGAGNWRVVDDNAFEGEAATPWSNPARRHNAEFPTLTAASATATQTRTNTNTTAPASAFTTSTAQGAWGGGDGSTAPVPASRMLAARNNAGAGNNPGNNAGNNVSPSAGGVNAGAGAGARRGVGGLTPLVPVRVSCACGRKTARVPVPMGEEGRATQLECDAACEREKRAKALADAFGVDPSAPDAHLSHWERNREANYTPEMLLYAKEHPSVVSQLQEAFAGIVRDRSKRREALPPMPKPDRRIAHLLANQYGLTCVSQGQEPKRHLECYKGANAGIPATLLSEAAARVTASEIAALQTESDRLSLYLTQVSEGANLDALLAGWRGYFVLHEGRDEARLQFRNAKTLRDCATQLGGGMKGAFTVDRTRGAFAPDTATQTSSTNPGVATSSGGAGGGGDWRASGGAGAGGSGGAGAGAGAGGSASGSWVAGTSGSAGNRSATTATTSTAAAPAGSWHAHSGASVDRVGASGAGVGVPGFAGAEEEWWGSKRAVRMGGDAWETVGMDTKKRGGKSSLVPPTAWTGWDDRGPPATHADWRGTGVSSDAPPAAPPGPSSGRDEIAGVRKPPPFVGEATKFDVLMRTGEGLDGEGEGMGRGGNGSGVKGTFAGLVSGALASWEDAADDDEDGDGEGEGEEGAGGEAVEVVSGAD